MLFSLATNSMIDLGFVIAAFVPLVLLWIAGEGHLRLIWRLTLGLGVIPPLILLYFRIKMKGELSLPPAICSTPCPAPAGPHAPQLTPISLLRACRVHQAFDEKYENSICAHLQALLGPAHGHQRGMVRELPQATLLSDCVPQLIHAVLDL